MYVNTVKEHNTEKTNQNCYSLRGGSLGRWRQGQECDFTRYSTGFVFWFWGCFWSWLKASGILFHWPGTEPMPLAVEVEAWSPNHWTTREIPYRFWNLWINEWPAQNLKEKKNQPKLLWWHTPIKQPPYFFVPSCNTLPATECLQLPLIFPSNNLEFNPSSHGNCLFLSSW